MIFVLQALVLLFCLIGGMYFGVEWFRRGFSDAGYDWPFIAMIGAVVVPIIVHEKLFHLSGEYLIFTYAILGLGIALGYKIEHDRRMWVDRVRAKKTLSSRR